MPLGTDTEIVRLVRQLAEDSSGSPPGTAEHLAELLGWRSAHVLTGARYTNGGDLSCHIVVEHGIAIPALITIARTGSPDRMLGPDRRHLLSLSYNQLLDWHIFASPTSCSLLNNRLSLSATIQESFPLIEENARKLGKDYVSGLARDRSRYEFPALDDEFVERLGYWRKVLFEALVISEAERLECIATLSNALVLARSVEDHQQVGGTENRLVDALLAEAPLMERFERFFRSSRIDMRGTDLVDVAKLEPFADLDPDLLSELVRDLYVSRSTGYPYDFSLIAKHALSRIYEKYVTRLQRDPRNRSLLFAAYPATEKRAKSLGAIYTPLFIASFLAEFALSRIPKAQYADLSVMDPCCGSGIFLRCVLEKISASGYPRTRDRLDSVFGNVVGIDVDRNAVHAAQLSLALFRYWRLSELHALPKVYAADALAEFEAGKLPSVDIILGNPPFVAYQQLEAETRQRIARLLGKKSFGKTDTYLGFLKLSLDRCAAGGIVGLVLPSAFFTSKNGTVLRRHIAEQFDVLCIADLSAIQIFESVSTYVGLLILRRRRDPGDPGGEAIVIQASDDVEGFLQAGLEARSARTQSGHVFRCPQSIFKRDEWVLLSPSDREVYDRLAALGRLADIAQVRQGIKTGYDKAFIVPREIVPKRERGAYMLLADDREIGRFVTKEPEQLLWYDPLASLRDEVDLKQRFPWSHEHLLRHRGKLEARTTVTTEGRPWYVLHRAREPLLRSPKIICPHFAALPRFAVDVDGRLAVTARTFIVPNEPDRAVLLWISAVLNSGVVRWWLEATAPRIRGGYVALEAKGLSAVPVPDIGRLSRAEGARIVQQVDGILRGEPLTRSAIDELERMVFKAYDLPDHLWGTVAGEGPA